MRELALAGLVAVVFGLGSFYATGEFGAFSTANLGLGSAALLVALFAGARRLSFVGGPHSRPVILRGLLVVALALVVGVGLERAAAWSGIRLDWTFEQSFELSDAIVKKLGELEGPVIATLYRDPLDPRIRHTRLLLETLARAGEVELRERDLEEQPEAAARHEVDSSNTVVLELGERWETLPRPTEGALYEALYRLDAQRQGSLLTLRGEGEGDLERSDPLGYSGLAAALATEGYALRSEASAALGQVPEGTDAVLLIAPRRPLLPRSLETLRRYLARGGRLVALLEPGTQSGVEGLLDDYGIHMPDALLFDPVSGRVQEEAVEGLDIVAFHYEEHPITRGLDRNRMTYFPGARPLFLRRPGLEGEVRRLVLSSHRAWPSEDLSWLERSSGRPEPDRARQGYQILVAAGRYPREAGEARIVAFGEADFASNRHLRTLYNLDLILNAVHWVTDREPAITLRPKVRPTVQFPVPLARSVRAFYGVGVLLPELLLIVGGIVWLRRRSA